MKKILSLLFLSAVLSLSAMAQSRDSVAVLFLGNSYTEVNNLPLLVQNVSASAGKYVYYQANTPGGATLGNHLTNGSLSFMNNYAWDVCVLQDQSQLPSFPDGDLAYYHFWENAANLVNEFYTRFPEGEVMFYMTWGRRDGDAANAQFFAPLGTYEGMDSMLYMRYMMLRDSNDASVSPVGRLWHYLRDNNPDIELYAGDGSHPSLAGSYAAACSFYTMLFEDDPMNITSDEGVDPADAAIIRRAAKAVVFDSISRWWRESTHRNDPGEPESIAVANDNFSLSVYPNPAKEMINIAVSHDDDLVIYDAQGRLWKRIHVAEGTTTLNLSDAPSHLLLIKSERNAAARMVVVQ